MTTHENRGLQEGQTRAMEAFSPPSPTLAPYHLTLQRSLANRHRRGVPSFDLDGMPPAEDDLPRRLLKHREEILRLRVELDCLLRECDDRIGSGKEGKVITRERAREGDRMKGSRMRRVVRRSALPELVLALVLGWALWRLSLELRYMRY